MTKHGIPAGMILVLWTAVMYLPAQERIYRRVDVVHREVVFRVVDQKQPVSGLQRTDVTLLINGREREILGFSEYAKKIEPDLPAGETAASAGPPRLFVCLMNISDYHLDFDQALDYLFEKVLKPSDRLIILTNNFFIQDRTVTALDRVRSRLDQILNAESRLNYRNRIAMENKLNSYRDDLMEFLSGGDGEADTLLNAIQEFYVHYFSLLRDYRGQMVDMAEKEYIKLARYLNDQHCEKYIINLYQIGAFPRLKRSSEIYKRFELYERLWRGEVYGNELRALRLNAELEFNAMSGSNTADISGFFIESGAAVHTLLMNYKGESSVLSDDFEYRPITTDAEQILTRISERTAGQVQRTLDIKTFMRDVGQSEDVYYILTYEPRPDDGTRPDLSLRLRQTGLTVLYSDQRREGYFSELVADQARNESLAEIKISDLGMTGENLTITVTDYQRSPDASGETVGRLNLRIRVLNAEASILFDRQRDISTPLNAFELNVNLDRVRAASFAVMVEVRDLNTGRNDLVFKEFTRQR